MRLLSPKNGPKQKKYSKKGLKNWIKMKEMTIGTTYNKWYIAWYPISSNICMRILGENGVPSNLVYV